ncbi:MAG: shikimate kinase [Alphaproteobacteria bacterium]|nr:shikimate kinase [Alphaproteobacteria bacterium]
MKKVIAIIGLMGVGKTTIGLKLARKLGYYFVDSDREIEDREHKSIAEIFAQNGEKYFREIEEKIIEEIVWRDEEIVLSIGGGGFMSYKTRQILKEKSVTIWLKAPIDEILRRVGNKENRPLLNQKNRRDVLEELVTKRYPIYAEADLHFDSSILNHEVLTKKIIKEIHEKNTR